jgi:hypothetical protein
MRTNLLLTATVSVSLACGSRHPGTMRLVGVSELGGLRLIRHDVTANGLLLLEYETTGAAPVGTYEGVAAIHAG